jgi:hypothetical protein
VIRNFILTIVQLDIAAQPRLKPRSLDYINNIDLNEKKELPAYTVTTPQRGVYFTYDEFKNNRPRLTSFVAVMARDELRKVMRSGTGDEESRRISRSDIFAVSDGQHVWVAAPLQYARLNKRGWDFYFRTTAYENNKVEEIALSYFFFSIPGAIIAAIPHEDVRIRLESSHRKIYISKKSSRLIIHGRRRRKAKTRNSGEPLNVHNFTAIPP